MKKKILCLGVIAALIAILFTLTGCGDKKNEKKQQEYTEAMMEVRNRAPGILNGKTIGEILDVALEDATWRKDTDYSILSGAVIVNGKDKKSGDEVELIWLTTVDSTESGFEKMTKGNERIGYSAFLDYLRDYIN